MNTTESTSSSQTYTNIHYGDDDIRLEHDSQGREILLFDPYNPVNRLIPEEELQALLKEYGVTVPIHNWELYKRAFIHRSYIKRVAPETTPIDRELVMAEKPANCLPLFSKSNERLEFVGDGVLECITKYYLYRRFPKENEGFMTEKKIALVKNESIGKIAYEMGLHKWFVMSKHSEMKATRTNLKKLGCLFEAFLGALFLDFNKIVIKDEHQWFANTFTIGPGFQMAQVFLETIFEKHVDWIELLRNDDNYKNLVQVKIQKEFKVTPHYLETHPYHAERGYTMGVFLCLGQPIYQASIQHAKHIQDIESYDAIRQHVNVAGKILVFLGEGSHRIKKKSEFLACENALKNLESF